jgi:hypothetical protein
MITEIRHVAPSGDTLREIASALDRQALRTRLAGAWWLERVTRIIKPDAEAG